MCQIISSSFRRSNSSSEKEEEKSVLDPAFGASIKRPRWLGDEKPQKRRISRIQSRNPSEIRELDTFALTASWLDYGALHCTVPVCPLHSDDRPSEDDKQSCRSRQSRAISRTTVTIASETQKKKRKRSTTIQR